MVVDTDVVAELLLDTIVGIAIAGGGGGRIIEPDDVIVRCIKFEELCCCRFENIVDGLISLAKIKQQTDNKIIVKLLSMMQS